MGGPNAAPGQPFAGVFGNYPQGNLSERRAVARQIATLGRPALGGAWQGEVVRRLQRRREGAGDAIQFQIIRSNDRNVPVVVELLVRTADYNGEGGGPFRPVAMQQLLAGYGFDATQVAELDNRVTRLSSDRYDPNQLADIARVLRNAGYQASLNQVTPLGPVVKGEAGPDVAAGLPEFERPNDCEHPITVAVVDTGVTDEVRADHWLAGLAQGNNVDPLNVFPLGAPDQYLDFGAGHGSFVAGIVQQIAPSAGLRVYRAIDSDGVGSEVDVATAMVRAVRDGARIINLSLGSDTVDNQPPLAIQVALELIDEHDNTVLVVASAGNNGDTVPVWPAGFPRVVSVAALDAGLRPATWSTRGPWVDCSAVGEGILSTYVKGNESPELDPTPDVFPADAWARWSGTSFTAVQISAAVARQCCVSGNSPRAEAAALLAQGVAIPDFGQALEILPGL